VTQRLGPTDIRGTRSCDATAFETVMQSFAQKVFSGFAARLPAPLRRGELRAASWPGELRAAPWPGELRAASRLDQQRIQQTAAAASPPGVRRGYAPPASQPRKWGYAPRSAFGPNRFRASPNQGRSPPFYFIRPAGQSPASHPAAKPRRTRPQIRRHLTQLHPAAKPRRTKTQIRQHLRQLHPAAKPRRTKTQIRRHLTQLHPAAKPRRTKTQIRRHLTQLHPAAKPK
jgi:hypothetical protein